MLQFLWVRSPGTVYLHSLVQGFSQAASKLSVRLWSHMKALLGKDLLPSLCVYWQDSVPWKLLTWGPQFLARSWLSAILSFIWLLHIAASFIKASKGEGLLARWKLPSYVIQSPKWLSATFAIVYLLAASPWASAHSRGRDYMLGSFGTILASGHHVGTMKDRTRFQTIIRGKASYTLPTLWQ